MSKRVQENAIGSVRVRVEILRYLVTPFFYVISAWIIIEILVFDKCQPLFYTQQKSYSLLRSAFLFANLLLFEQSKSDLRRWFLVLSANLGRLLWQQQNLEVWDTIRIYCTEFHIKPMLLTWVAVFSASIGQCFPVKFYVVINTQMSVIFCTF